MRKLGFYGGSAPTLSPIVLSAETGGADLTPTMEEI